MKKATEQEANYINSLIDTLVPELSNVLRENVFKDNDSEINTIKTIGMAISIGQFIGNIVVNTFDESSIGKVESNMFLNSILHAANEYISLNKAKNQDEIQ